MVAPSRAVQRGVVQEVDHPDGPVTVASRRAAAQPDLVDRGTRRIARKPTTTSRPAPSRPAPARSGTIDHPMLSDPRDRSWTTWARNRANIAPALERVLERQPGSLRNAPTETLTKALDEVRTRYGFGEPGQPASLRELFVTRQQALRRSGPLGQQGLTERQVDGKLGPITMGAEDSFRVKTGALPGPRMSDTQVPAVPTRGGVVETQPRRDGVVDTAPHRDEDAAVQPQRAVVPPEGVVEPPASDERRFSSDESREIAGLAGDHPERVPRRVNELYDRIFDRGKLLDSLGRDLTPEEQALLPEHVRSAIEERGVLRRVRDGLDADRGEASFTAPTQADVNDTPAGRLAAQRIAARGEIESWWRGADPEARQRAAQVLHNELSPRERWLLGDQLVNDIGAVATRRPPSTPGGAPERGLPMFVEPLPGRRAEQIKSHLATDTPQGRLDAQQLALQWDRAAFVDRRRDELADELGRGLTAPEVARLPPALRHRIEARQLVRQVVDGLQLPDRRFSAPSRQEATPAQTESRERTVASLRDWLASADPQNGTHVRAAQALYEHLKLEFDAQRLLSRDLFARLKAFAND